MKSPSANEHYNDNVFLNCPIDSVYKELFDAMVFAVHDCGFIASCVLEEADASQVRIDKIYDIIAECRYGIHDISRTELDEVSGFPRFNMPLELGVFLGEKKFGIDAHKRKNVWLWTVSRTDIKNSSRIFLGRTFRLITTTQNRL